MYAQAGVQMTPYHDPVGPRCEPESGDETVGLVLLLIGAPLSTQDDQLILRTGQAGNDTDVFRGDSGRIVAGCSRDMRLAIPVASAR